MRYIHEVRPSGKLIASVTSELRATVIYSFGESVGEKNPEIRTDFGTMINVRFL